MHIEIELAFEIVRPEFSKVGLIPDDNIGLADIVEACPAREEGVYDWGQELAILLYKFGL